MTVRSTLDEAGVASGSPAVASAASIAVAVDRLSIEYRGQGGRVRAVRSVSFEVGRGETVGLIGESGSGKSTVALALLRLLPPNGEVTGGRITLTTPTEPAIDVLRLSERQLRSFRWSACALVPQGAISALNPLLRVGEHVDETAAAHDYPSANARARARELLQRVRLDPDRAWRAYPHELSGGMRQRVQIALALLLAPRLLILDEPTTALDTITQRSVLEALRELRRTEDLSLLFISHDLAVAAELCDRIVTMYAGRVVEAGPTIELVSRSRHPYTIGLLEAIPRLGGDNAGVHAIPGSPPDLGHLPPGCPFEPRCPLAAAICTEADPDLVTIGLDHAAACHRWREAGILRTSGVAVSA